MTILLTSANAPASASGRRAVPPQGIVHLGLGNFHRAHQAVYTDAAVAAAGGDWGILGVASRSAQVADALRRQDMRYTVAEISPGAMTCSVPTIHTGAIVAAADPEAVVAAVGDETTRIVSLTVTEHGYTFSPATKGLDHDHPGVRHDLTGGAPRTTIGQIVGGLRRRMSGHGRPITVLSCDNLNSNGARTRRLVLEFAAALGGSEADELSAWIGRNVTFPSTMVDRIVPATSDRHRAAVAEMQGYRDDVPVVAEPFTMWVLEDDFAAGRPAWEAGGAVFSTQVDRYEQLKVRLLNGTHSLIAYLGALSGVGTIAASVTLAPVESAARRVLEDEYLPSVHVPDGVDVAAYEEQLFERWRNVALGHRTAQVGSDGSAKLRERIPEPALRFRAENRMPHLLALTAAGYLACVAPLDGGDPGEYAHAMTDPAREWLAGAAAASRDGRDLAHRVLRDRRLLGDDIAGWGDFIDRVGELTDVLRIRGAEQAIADAVGAGSQKY